MAETVQKRENQNSLELIRASEMHHHSGSRIYTHARKTFGLIYVLTGSAIYEFDGIPYPVKAGDLFCIPENIPFSMRPIEKTDYNTRQFGLIINDQSLDQRLRLRRPPLIVDGTLKSMLDYLIQYWNMPAPENKSLIETFLRAILAQFYIQELNYDNPVSAYVLTDGYSPATKKILYYTEANRYTRLSLDEMAQTLGYNKNYLCSTFVQDTGLTILSYAHFLKIRQAIVHFFYWGTSLSEVCELLSFDSKSYFTVLFKDITGVSPGAFRKACLSLEANDRTEINTGTLLFTSRPISIDALLSSMQQLVESITESTNNKMI